MAGYYKVGQLLTKGRKGFAPEIACPTNDTNEGGRVRQIQAPFFGPNDSLDGLRQELDPRRYVGEYQCGGLCLIEKRSPRLNPLAHEFGDKRGRVDFYPLQIQSISCNAVRRISRLNPSAFVDIVGIRFAKFTRKHME